MWLLKSHTYEFMCADYVHTGFIFLLSRYDLYLVPIVRKVSNITLTVFTFILMKYTDIVKKLRRQELIT